MSRMKKVLTGVVTFASGAVAVSLIADQLFKRNTASEVNKLLSTVENKGERITQKDIEGLPLTVKKWLMYSGIVGKEKIISLRSKQKAEMRESNDKPWMPLDAEQYFTTTEPAFIWRAKVKAAPFIHIAGKDKYINGKGGMLIQLQSLFTIADSKGREVDQGSLLRYLAETVWFPSAVLSDYITWEGIDDYTAKAVITYGNITASGLFIFNDKGEVIRFEAERYGEFEGEFSMETWSISMKDYRDFDGIKVPVKGSITWKLEKGDFLWYRFTVENIQFNTPLLY